MNRRQGAIAAIVVFGLVAGWMLFIGLPRWYAGRRIVEAPAAAAPSAAAPSAVR